MSQPMTEVEKMLESVAWLKDASAGARSELARFLQARSYPRGNILYFHGDPGGAVFLVLSGEVKVGITSEEGREVVFKVMGRGMALGLVSALSDEPHLGTAVTLSDARIARIAREDLTGWLGRHPVVLSSLVQDMAGMVREAYVQIARHALLPVKQRLLLALAELGRREGGENGGSEVSLGRPTNQQLADLVGSSRVVISRLLKELEEEDEAIVLEGRTVRVRLEGVILEDPLGGY